MRKKGKFSQSGKGDRRKVSFRAHTSDISAHTGGFEQCVSLSDDHTSMVVVLVRDTLSALHAGPYPHARRNFIVAAWDTCGMQGILMGTIGIFWVLVCVRK